MNAVEAFLTTYPQLQLALDVFSLIVPPACFLAFAGLGPLSGVALMQGVRQRRASFSKCARQLAMFALILGWVFLIGMRVWLYFVPAPATSQLSLLYEIIWLLLAVSVLFSSLTFALWSFFSKHPLLYTAISAFQALLAFKAFLLQLNTRQITPMLETLLAGPLSPTNPATWQHIRNSLDPQLFLPLLTPFCYSVLLFFALPAAFGVCWLYARRRYDDYGRDHYNAMIPWCAGKARNAWFALWILQVILQGRFIFMHWQNGGFTGQDAALQTAPLLLWLMPAILWTVVSSSKFPLRHGITLFLALLVAICFMLPLSLEAAGLPPVLDMYW